MVQYFVNLYQISLHSRLLYFNIRNFRYCNLPKLVFDTDGKEPSLLGFGSVRVLTKLRVQFGSSS